MPEKTLKKEERLKRRKVIGRLFEEGRSFGQYPLRLVWISLEERQGLFPVQFSLSVPRKRFRRAVDRNRLRRRIREAYRLNKHHLYRALAGEPGQLAIMIIYTGQEEFSFAEIEKAMQLMIRRFIKKYRAEKSPANHRET